MKYILGIALVVVMFIAGLVGNGIRALFPDKPAQTTTAATTVPIVTEPHVPALAKTAAIVTAEIQLLTERTGAAVTTNQVGTVTTYSVTGARLKDILEANGVSVDGLADDAYLLVVGSDGTTAKYDAALIKADDTILAWAYTSVAVDGITGATTNGTGAAKDLPRMFPCCSGASGLYVKQVAKLELYI